MQIIDRNKQYLVNNIQNRIRTVPCKSIHPSYHPGGEPRQNLRRACQVWSEDESATMSWVHVGDDITHKGVCCRRQLDHDVSPFEGCAGEDAGYECESQDGAFVRCGVCSKPTWFASVWISCHQCLCDSKQRSSDRYATYATYATCACLG